jgi:uncharacterized damage-inducible protein DinB
MLMIKAFLLTELDAEVRRSRKVLEQMPEGKGDWKPHEKSMTFGYLAELVAIMPSWITLQVTRPDFDIAPADGSTVPRTPKTTTADYLQSLDDTAASAKKALEETSDEHFTANWQLKVRGAVVQEAPRVQMIQETFNHWAHHRGQMTVYLRLMGAKVPAVYGPSADDKSFS